MSGIVRKAGSALILGLVVFNLAGPAAAGPITTLFSTGVDAGGGLLADGAVDPHYTVDAGANTFTIGNPAGVGWVNNTAGSQWISPIADTGAGPGPFTYATTFDLTGLDPATAEIIGEWSSDNQAQMFLNGNLVATDPFPGWTSLVAFSIDSGFVAGLNTLTFVVPNALNPGGNDGPTGLQVHIISATVPEPSSLALFGLGALGLLRRRRNRGLVPARI